MLFSTEEMVNCAHCGLQSGCKKSWGKVDGLLMCNACYIYHRKNGRFRTRAMIEKSNCKMKSDHKHVQCQWKMKLVLYSDDLSSLKVFKGRRNDFFHSEEAYQESKRPSQSQRDLWDQQILSAGHASKSSLITKKIKSMGDGSVSLIRIRSRLKRIKQSRNVQLQVSCLVFCGSEEEIFCETGIPNNIRYSCFTKNLYLIHLWT
jgi:hypothetical protein